MDKIEKHLKALKEKHAELEIKLNEEEARPLPDSLKIQEYKKQILVLEKQSQNYQKQYSALNDLISLFIQTTK